MTFLPQTSIRIHVRHPLPLVEAGLEATLAGRPGFEMTRASGADDVDVTITDLEGGMAQLKQARQASRGPDCRMPRVLVVADCDVESHVRAALELGVLGYALVDCRLDSLVTAVRAVARGSRYLCERTAARLADSLAREALTPREKDVLSLMTRGFTNKAIARELQIAVGTVKAHTKSIFAKLNVQTRVQAAVVTAGQIAPPAFPALDQPMTTGGFATGIRVSTLDLQTAH